MSGSGIMRAAVVGTGFVGPHHVDAIRRGGYAEVVAIVGSDEERTRARARALGVERGTADLAAVLADPSIDVVHVCTPRNRCRNEIEPPNRTGALAPRGPVEGRCE